MEDHSYEQLLEALLSQEEELQFTQFSNQTALEVGMMLYEAAKALGKSVSIDITRNGQRLFHYAMEGTSIDNAEWIRRKNNVVNRFGHSSYYVGRLLKSQGAAMEDKFLIPSSEYAAHGGSFPMRIKRVGLVGTITVSGLPQKEDHDLIVNTLRTYLNRIES
jgi:uncharacterized protein (UPF0303 family)